MTTPAAAPDAPPAEAPGTVPPSVSEPVEARIRRLEAALAAIQDTRLLEERVVERVVQHIETTPPPPANGGSADLLLSAGRLLLPQAAGVFAAPPVGPLPPPASPWLLIDLIQEIRLFPRLFTDYRFRPGITARLAPPTALALAIVSWLMLSNVPLIGWALDKVAVCLIAVLLYKILARETARYRAVLSNFAASRSSVVVDVTPAPSTPRNS